MKTQLKKHILFCLGLACFSYFFFACEPNKEEQNDGLAASVTPPPEDVLDLITHTVEATAGETLIDKCKDSILVDSIYALPRVAGIVHEDALAFLKSEAVKLRTGDNDNSVLAVRIIYGLDNSNQMKLFYQPLFLKRTTGPAIKLQAEYTATAAADRYEYISSSPPSFSVASVATLTTAVSNYTNHITFRNSSNVHFRKFLATGNTDPKGDVKAIAYSFQEIDSVMHGNGVHNIYFLNSAENIYTNNKTYLRHSLLLAPDEDLQPLYLFYMKYGNLTHLCPPNCSALKFNRK